ncbi:uncharacterized protein [Palaemon carinicauda]|uniref:uncharacterized protein n=1 Tax=Palaemon carinicauda TaxID=392227 RepID=UPI0035B5E1D5
MSNNTSLYRDALFDDGCYVLRQVVITLYQGGTCRPDVYFQTAEKLWQKYSIVFTNDQRRIIESSGTPYDYNIQTGVARFDASILSHLAEHTCDLLPSDEILVNVLKVKNLMNIASYSLMGESVTSADLCNKLDSLLVLYIAILERLEHHALCYLHLEKEEITKRIQEKKTKSRSNNSFSGQSFVPKAPPAFYVSSANRNITTHQATPAFYASSGNRNITTHEATPAFFTSSANRNITTHEATPAFYTSSANRNITTHEATPAFYTSSANRNITTHEEIPTHYVSSANRNITTKHEETHAFYASSDNRNITAKHEATPAYYVSSANRSPTATHEATPAFDTNSANRSKTTRDSHSGSPSLGEVALGITGKIGKTAYGVTGDIGKTALGVTGEIGKTAVGITGEIGKTALGVTGEIGKATIGVFGAVAGIFTKK